MQEEIEALKKNSVPKGPENRNGEWLNLESRNLVPGDLVKLESGGLVCADEEALDGKWIRVNTSHLNGAGTINFTAGGETNQVREHLFRAQLQSQLGSRVCSQSTLTRPPFVFSWTWASPS